MNNNRVVVVGAGIVGAASALELQRRGYEVKLVDRDLPGRETSYGNAGILSDSSVIIVNNPKLPFRLPKMLLNTNISLRYNLGFALSRLPWIIKFLFFSTKSHMHHAGRALRELQVMSLDLHKSLIAEAGAEHLLSNSGWLKLYRSEKGYESSQGELAFLREMGVKFSEYSADELLDLEPDLKPIYHRGVLMTDTCSVSSPSELTETYTNLFTSAGGKFIEAEVRSISARPGNGWKIQLAEQDALEADRVVIAAGPWSAEIAKWLGYKIPMAWERGYHTHFEPNGSNQLTRPIHDVEGGFVAAPQQQGIRVLTGVELTYRDAPPNFKQIRAAAAGAREALELGREIDPEPWLGRRPTLADSLPMVGAATKHDGLWFNFGHQHVGLSTSTGCAEMLADLMENKAPRIDHTPFKPERFHL